MRHGAGVLAIKEGKVLLVKAGPKSKQVLGQLSFPGGNLEVGETEEQAAKREFTEETGLTAIELLDFPGNYVEDRLHLKVGEVDYSFRVFLCQKFEGQIQSNQETEAFWANVEEARKMNLLGKNNQILEAAINFLKL